MMGSFQVGRARALKLWTSRQEYDVSNVPYRCGLVA